MTISISPGDTFWTGLILLESPDRATTVAMFNAMATENRIKHIPGFAGAAFMVDETNSKVLEFVRWTDRAAFEAVQEDFRYYEHIRIAEQFCHLKHLAFTSDLTFSQSTPIMLSRGREIGASFEVMSSPETLRSAVGPSGVNVTYRASRAIVPPVPTRVVLSGTPTSPDFTRFTVVEACAPPAAEEVMPVLFHLLPVE